MRPELALKEAKKKEKKLRDVTIKVTYLPGPPTLLYRHQRCHVGCGPGRSQPWQVSSKSVQGFWLTEGSKPAIYGLYHSLHGSRLVNGTPPFLDTQGSKTPEPIDIKLDTGANYASVEGCTYAWNCHHPCFYPPRYFFNSLRTCRGRTVWPIFVFCDSKTCYCDIYVLGWEKNISTIFREKNAKFPIQAM